MFKVGEQVKCIDNGDGNDKYLTIGKLYQILKQNSEFVYVKPDPYDIQIIPVYPHRFKKACTRNEEKVEARRKANALI